jgi:phytoene dehydrogenase-like protein
VLAQAGIEVEVYESAATIGGGAQSGELTLPGFIHDLGSAVHPMAISSPFFNSLQLHRFGLEWLFSPAELAHPMDDGTAITLERNLESTSRQLGSDASSYSSLIAPLTQDWPALYSGVFRPLGIPQHPFVMGRFGRHGVLSASRLGRQKFRETRARALFAGCASHSTLSLTSPMSAAFGLLFLAAGHATGWPMPKGGAQSIANALGALFKSLGGVIRLNARVENLEQLGSPDLTLCDVTPRQFLDLAQNRLKPAFRKLLEHFEYGPGAFKVDYALSSPIPWKSPDTARAITVHLGGTFEEIVASERRAPAGLPPTAPFVLLTQPSLFDPTRAPAGKHIAWAYCHVPNGWRGSALEQIESQIERFAPGFRDCVLARAVFSTEKLEQWNPNLVGGDVNGGALKLGQFFSRPTWRRYGTPLRGVYLCSSSTPPGGGVHGMCGFWAARAALRSLKN